MKKGKNKTLTAVLTLLLVLPTIAMTTAVPTVNAGEIQGYSVGPKLWKNIWYKFETPLVTLLFPANGKKPMFLWWYTNDNSTIYVVKFKGVIEYLTFNLPYYDRRYNADSQTLQQMLMDKFVEPKLGGFQDKQQHRNAILGKLAPFLIGFHKPYLPFNACTWSLSGPELVVKGNVSYWSFNFTLNKVPLPRFDFAENNIQIRCRFYNATTTEIVDENHNYTVAAGQLKFDFVVGNWEWNIDKLRDFVYWLEKYQNLNITIPSYKTGLALWLNMASIRIENLSAAENEVQSQYRETVETQSNMQAVKINDEHYKVNDNKTQNEYERQVQVTSRFRNRTRIQYANVEKNLSGFLEFVPWARLMDETGETVDYIDVTASYIAAGAHLRLFVCYPYFGNYTMEHDPTIGLDAAPLIPTLIPRMMLFVLIGATIIIIVAVAAVKLLKKPVNLIKIQ